MAPELWGTGKTVVCVVGILAQYYTKQYVHVYRVRDVMEVHDRLECTEVPCCNILYLMCTFKLYKNTCTFIVCNVYTALAAVLCLRIMYVYNWIWQGNYPLTTSFILITAFINFPAQAIVKHCSGF